MSRCPRCEPVDEAAILLACVAEPERESQLQTLRVVLVGCERVVEEVGYSARDPQDLHAGLREPPVASMPVEYATPAAEDRAVEVLALLAERGHHRAPSVPDLLIAAITERAGLVVLHQDKDLIAHHTGQSSERIGD